MARQPRAKNWPDGLSDRLSRCRAAMAKKRLDGYLITDRMDQLYLTGFTGEDGAALISARSVTIITDGRFTETVGVEAPWAKAFIRKGPLPDAIARKIQNRKLTRVGVDPSSVNVGLFQTVRKAMRPCTLAAVDGILSRLRLCKQDPEIEATRRAILVAEQAFRATLRRVRIGQTELEIAARLEYEMKTRGAAGASFDIIVAEGPNSSVPHAHPGNRKVRSGSAVLCDWGAIVNHYRSDLTRVFFVDKVPPPFRRIYPVVLEAQRRGIEAIRPGAKMSAVDAAARRHITAKGYGKAFGHGLGHGLGLNIHEPPRLAKKVDDRLQEGMIVTVEPGIYLPGVGGVRIEDDVVVTAEGFEVLSSLPKELDEMIIPGR